MVFVTHIYEDFENEISSTYKFRASVKAQGYELMNACTTPGVTPGYMKIIRDISNVISTMPEKLICYADGADCCLIREFYAQADVLLYMTEQAYWEPTGGEERYTDKTSPWCYLNGGGYCGMGGLITEFQEKYLLPILDDYPNTPQQAQHAAYFAAKEDGFPVMLDEGCKIFQAIGHSRHFFEVRRNDIVNIITETTPALFHGNGRTQMDWVYKVAGV